MVKAKRGGLDKYIISFTVCASTSVFPGGGGRKEKGESGDQKALTLSSPIWALVVKSN